MRLMVLAGLMITLPAIVVMIYALLAGRPLLAIGAIASFAVNSVPFIVGLFFFRNRRGTGGVADH